LNGENLSIKGGGIYAPYAFVPPFFAYRKRMLQASPISLIFCVYELISDFSFCALSFAYTHKAQMDPGFPYYPPHTENACDQSIKGNAGSSLLLTTDPKDLDKLFDRSIEAEQDICFPTKRPISSSISSTTTAAFSPPPRKHNGHSSFQNSSINVNALSSWFTDIDMHSSMAQHYQPTKQTKKKLSLYGDNHHIVEDSKEDRYMYFHPDTGIIRGKSLLELKLPPHLTVEQLLLKENFWIDVTSPSLAEMKAISKVETYIQ
jgi:hypothetical protein